MFRHQQKSQYIPYYQYPTIYTLSLFQIRLENYGCSYLLAIPILQILSSLIPVVKQSLKFILLIIINILKWPNFMGQFVFMSVFRKMIGCKALRNVYMCA